ncbi:hypothetical protein QKL80_gp2 [Rodent Torque teno virus 8]|uniref:Uncharacterized protein n=1 Tax=Rodent Torque teno virus 8 TaxID=2054615 RepID=A0A2H4QBF5_9VIRU|nr:hypothetical protein QKL80_gp2 [Rodent Torque teno virus 8]ATX61878.1 hypothetical protein [Rodent Torque teno virus 8]
MVHFSLLHLYWYMVFLLHHFVVVLPKRWDLVSIITSMDIGHVLLLVFSFLGHYHTSGIRIRTSRYSMVRLRMSRMHYSMLVDFLDLVVTRLHKFFSISIFCS